MTAPWPRAIAYAVVVTMASLAVQAVVCSLMLLLSGEPVRSVADLVLLPTPVFSLCAIVVLTVARMALSALPRWRTAAVDTALYMLVLLLVSIGYAAYGGGLAEAVDFGFVMLTMGMLTLQLPAALAVSALAQPRLVAAPGSAELLRQPQLR
ncbi:hypothetical protein [Streptomyces sp. cmx-18-6]|uniref:hypothetical protein n=1 Tax=Streptomyces sp. cmx-18-6 TaxID=2790930 RepID=UPI00397FD980